MLEVAFIIMMFIGVGMAMRMDVSPRKRVSAAPKHAAKPAAAPASQETTTPRAA